MLSDAILNSPSSEKAKLGLLKLAADERIVQLCNIEAMAQVAAWNKAFLPDFVVAHAFADTKFSGNSLIADGAAFHSAEQWYAISFKCSVAPDHKTVVAFEFNVGDPVPKHEWRQYNLPTNFRQSD